MSVLSTLPYLAFAHADGAAFFSFLSFLFFLSFKYGHASLSPPSLKWVGE